MSPPPTKGDRNYHLIEFLLAGGTTPQAAKKFNISPQRVSQIVKYYKLDLKSQRQTKKAILIEEFTPLLGTMRDTDIAKRFNVPANTVHYARKKLGIKAFLKPIGCARCITHPWAKGLCRNCYERARRRALKEQA
jgi:transposase